MSGLQGVGYLLYSGSYGQPTTAHVASPQATYNALPTDIAILVDVSAYGGAGPTINWSQTPLDDFPVMVRNVAGAVSAHAITINAPAGCTIEDPANLGVFAASITLGGTNAFESGSWIFDRSTKRLTLFPPPGGGGGAGVPASWHTFPFLNTQVFTPTFTGAVFGEGAGGGGGGGGGAGGSVAANRGSGGGGGGGPQFLTRSFDVVAGTPYTVTIGVGGPGGTGGTTAVDGQDGGSGGPTSLVGGAISIVWPGGGRGRGGKLAADAGFPAGEGGGSTASVLVNPPDDPQFATIVTSQAVYQPPGYGGTSSINGNGQSGAPSIDLAFAGGAGGASPNGIGGGGGGAGGYGAGTAGGAGGASTVNGSNAPAGPAANTSAGGGGGGGGGGGAATTGGNGANGGSGQLTLRAYF